MQTHKIIIKNVINVCRLHWPQWRSFLSERRNDEFPMCFRQYDNTAALCPKHKRSHGKESNIFICMKAHFNVKRGSAFSWLFYYSGEDMLCISSPNSVTIKSRYIFSCFCALVNFCLKYSELFVLLLFARSGDLDMLGKHICCLCKYHKENLS